MTKIIIIFLVLIIISVLIVFLVTKTKNKKKVVEQPPIYNFTGAAYTNIVMYKSRQEKFIGVILNKYDRFTKDSLFKSIDDLATRLINGQNNGLMSQSSFEKTAIDDILIKMRVMKKVDISIINYDAGYMSVAMIFEDNTKNLYQLLMKLNVQNGLLYLDSYNATLWFKND